ncbi:MAG TPA: DnaD domain protein, partial [Clostridiales bacterium]|nr:DnaD domain protein [Clostridiales bacterium]
NNNDNNDNKYIDDDECAREDNPYFFYQNNFGTLSSFVAERIKALEEDIGSEMVIEAMKIAQLNKATSFKYVEAVVKNWLAKNIKTPEALKALEAEKQRHKSKPKEQDQPLDIDYEESAKSKYGW